MGTMGAPKFTTRYTLKLTYMAGADSITNYIRTLKQFFKQLQKAGDKKAFLAL